MIVTTLNTSRLDSVFSYKFASNKKHFKDYNYDRLLYNCEKYYALLTEIILFLSMFHHCVYITFHFLKILVYFISYYMYKC